jgi:putative ATP-dependent endonuclease of the OLD family
MSAENSLSMVAAVLASAPLLKITDIRVSNFRSLHNVEVKLDELTVLIGANNAGKTSLLDALYLAIGSGRKSLGAEDIRLASDETAPPRTRRVIIDLRMKLHDVNGKPLDSFPSGSFWTSLWGTGIAQDPLDDFNEFVAIRTTLTWNASKAEYSLKREFLKEWRSLGDWLDASTDKALTLEMIEPVALHYIDAKRDLDDDLKRQGSFWRRMIDDLGLSDSEVAAVEASLSSLNEQIVDHSDVLKHVKAHLSDLEKVIYGDSTGIELAPVSRKLRDMAKGIDVSLSNSVGQSFPLARHGMGTRSLASLLVFRAYASWKVIQAAKTGSSLHTLLALEEPEAHLHPQAQRSLFAHVKEIPGQRIVSTHSPYFAGQANLSSLRLFQKVAGETNVSQLDLSQVSADDLRKLEGTVIHTRGDLLFARGLVFFEGQTEEQALPIWATQFWGVNIHELGFSFICVGGTDYHPFLWLADSLNIPWHVLADGEAKPLAKLEKDLKRLGYNDAVSCSNVVVHPNGNNFEKQLLAEGYNAEIEQALDVANETTAFLDTYIDDLHGSMGKKNVPRDYRSLGGRERATLDAMAGCKTRLARPLATLISKMPDPERRFPSQLSKLFTVMSAQHGLKKAQQ